MSKTDILDAKKSNSTNKKKLMLIVPMLHQGGFEKVCVETARILKDKYDITILIFSSEDIVFDINGLNVISIDVPATDNKLMKVINVLRRVIKVRKYKKKLSIDYAYSFGITASRINVLSRVGERVLTGLRGYTDLEDESYIDLIGKKSDVIVCCSKVIEEEVRSKFGYSNTAVLYNPYNLDRIKSLAVEDVNDRPQKGDNKYIVTMSREDDLKGFWHLIKAFSIVAKEREDARLVFIGDGTFERYKGLADKLGILDRLVFTGVKSNPYPYLAMADMYILSSIHEGFPNALVEAMALGIPVMATNCTSGPAEILSANMDEVSDKSRCYEASFGRLLPALTEEPDFDSENIPEEDRALAGQILDGLADENWITTYGIKAKERAAYFNEESYKNNFVSIIESLK